MITALIAIAALLLALENGRTAQHKETTMSNQIQDLTAQLQSVKAQISTKLDASKAAEQKAEADLATAQAQLAAATAAQPSPDDMTQLAQAVADLAALGTDAQPPAPQISVVASASGSSSGSSQS